MDTFEEIKTRIKEALVSQKTYTQDMDTAIDLTAGCLIVRNTALQDVKKLKKSFVREKSREGNVKLVEHPAFRTLAYTTEMVRKCLRELRLTISSVEGGTGTGDDEIEDLINKVNEVEE